MGRLVELPRPPKKNRPHSSATQTRGITSIWKPNAIAAPSNGRAGHLSAPSPIRRTPSSRMRRRSAQNHQRYHRNAKTTAAGKSACRGCPQATPKSSVRPRFKHTGPTSTRRARRDVPSVTLKTSVVSKSVECHLRQVPSVMNEGRRNSARPRLRDGGSRWRSQSPTFP